MSKPTKPAVDLDALIEANMSNKRTYVLTEQLAGELRHFAKRAEEGRAIKRKVLVDYIRTNHGMPTIGPSSVLKLVREAGAKPWFSA